jgi:murein DD-endopeptidase MepM/ murein hydrolase activator NlpD
MEGADRQDEITVEDAVTASQQKRVFQPARGKSRENTARLAVMVLASLSATPINALELELPLQCAMGKDCFIQQYVDHDAGPGAADYTCGISVYDGHDGTDFRIRTTRDRVLVTAAAAGKVLGIRDEMPDRIIRTDADRQDVANRECGNGVVLAHEDGFETQYCHMKQGSIIVRKGETVASGQTLGEVGYSGMAQFPHVHLSVRQGKTRIDPFSGPMGETCEATDKSMWSGQAAAALAYQDGNILDAGLAPAQFSLNDIEGGRIKPAIPQADWPQMVSYAWLINLRANDEIRLTLTAADGRKDEQMFKLDRSKAQYVIVAKLDRTQAQWPKGAYTLDLQVTNDGKARLSRTVTQEIP